MKPHERTGNDLINSNYLFSVERRIQVLLGLDAGERKLPMTSMILFGLFIRHQLSRAIILRNPNASTCLSPRSDGPSGFFEGYRIVRGF